MNNYYLADLLEKYKSLQSIKYEIIQTFEILKKCFENNGTLFLCGNGGSAADAEHIVGELMKSFMLPRRVKNKNFISSFEKLYESDSKNIISALQEGMKAVSLTGHPSLATAYLNDVQPDMVFAQQLYILSRPGDVFMGISTSGNSSNVYKALQVATVKKLDTIILTGSNGGKCSKEATCSIKAPSDVVYKIQDYHVPIYHTLCLMLEDYFYGDDSEQ